MNGYFVIGGLVLIGLIIFIFYSQLLKEKDSETVLLKGPTKFKEDFEKDIDLSNLGKLDNFGKGYGLTLSWEMYIPNYSENVNYNSSFNKLKPIMKFGDSPKIYYHPKNGYLSIILKYTDNPFYSNYPEIKIENIKLQKWNKCILIINDRHVNFYIDGKLVKSRTIMNVPVIDFNNNLILGELNNNFHGNVKNIKLLTYPINIKNANKM